MDEIVVQLPGGGSARFPAGTSAETITGALKQFSGGQPAPPPPDTRSTLRKAGDYISGVADQATSGFLGGLADEFGAVSAATGQSVFGWKDKEGQPALPGSSWGEYYDAALKAERDKRAKFSDANPVASAVANVAGGIGGAGTAVGSAVAHATTWAPRAIQYAAAGAVPGAMYAFNEGEGGFEKRAEAAVPGAAYGAALGLAGGYAGDAIVGALRRWGPGAGGAAPPPPAFGPGGQLTPEGRAMMERAGIRPEAITQGYAQEFERRAAEAASAGRPVDPTQLARALQGETLPVPVPQTRGQVTGSPSQQMFENLAEKGTYGPRTERVMQGVRADQQAALGANQEAIATALGAGPIRAEGQIPGQTAQARLAAMRAQEKAAVDAAYAHARGSGAAGVPAEHVTAMRGALMDELGANHALANIPKVAAVLRPLEAVPSGGGSVPINNMFQVRQQLNGVIRGGGEDAVAARTAKGVLDRHLDEAVMRGLLQGDQNAIAAWRAAVDANREFAGRFKGGDVIEKLTAADWRSGTRQLVVPPDQATAAIFNSRTVFGGGNTARDVARLREVLGPQSPEWMALRQEAVMRLFQRGEGALNPTTGMREFSGANYAKALDDAMRNAPDVMRTFFTADELATLQQFRQVAARATGTVKGGDNFSNTTVAGAGLVRDLLGRLFTSESAMMRAAAAPLIRSLTDYGAGAAAANVTRVAPATLPPLDPLAARWAAPAGGALAEALNRRQGQ